MHLDGRRAASLLLGAGSKEDADNLETLDSFLNRHRFSAFFIEHFITPLVSAVWSCGSSDALRYPARYLFVFLDHHGMLSVFGSPTWRTVVGGSARYVHAIASRLHELHRWREPLRMLQLARLLVIERPGQPRLRPEDIDERMPGVSRWITVIETPGVAISSTELRQRVANGRSIRYLVPDPVAAYIQEHRLYRTK